MNKSAIAVVLSLGLVVVPFAHAKKRSDQAYIESYAGRVDIPVPIAVVSPVVDGEHAGTEVQLEFVVDVTGTPVDITTSEPIDRELAAQLTKAVAQWKFTPAHNAAGEAIARKVVLPVRIVDDSAKRFAMR